MLERRLRIYFGYFPTWQVAVLAIGVLWLLLGLRLAPFGVLPAGNQDKLHRIFSEVLGLGPTLEGLTKGGIFLCAFPLPLFLAGWGGYNLWLHWQYRLGKEEEGDLLIGQALAHLPRRVIERMGLPEDLMHYDVLVLWGPDPEDRKLALPPLPIHEPLESVTGVMRVGKDGLGRFARYDVLVLLRDETHLYLKDGFFDITRRKFSGERTAEYRLEDISKIMEDEPHSRLALRFKDGWQYEVSLLGGREASRVFSPFQVPLVHYDEALSLLRTFVFGEGVLPVRLLTFGNQRTYTRTESASFQKHLAEALSVPWEQLSVRCILPGSIWFSIEAGDLEKAKELWKLILGAGDKLGILRTEFSPQKPALVSRKEQANWVEEQLEHTDQNLDALARLKQHLEPGQTEARKEIAQQEGYLAAQKKDLEKRLQELMQSPGYG